jgi:hypothetical protein
MACAILKLFSRYEFAGACRATVLVEVMGARLLLPKGPCHEADTGSTITVRKQLHDDGRMIA